MSEYIHPTDKQIYESPWFVIFEANGIIALADLIGDEIVVRFNSGAECVSTCCDSSGIILNKADALARGNKTRQDLRKWSWCYPDHLTQDPLESSPYTITPKELTAFKMFLNIWNMALNKADSANNSFYAFVLVMAGMAPKTPVGVMAVAALSGGETLQQQKEPRMPPFMS